MPSGKGRPSDKDIKKFQKIRKKSGDISGPINAVKGGGQMSDKDLNKIREI